MPVTTEGEGDRAPVTPRSFGTRCFFSYTVLVRFSLYGIMVINKRKIAGKIPTQKAEAAVAYFPVREATTRRSCNRRRAPARPRRSQDDAGVMSNAKPAERRKCVSPALATPASSLSSSSRRPLPSRVLPGDPSLTSPPSPHTQVPVPRQGASPGAAGAHERQLSRTGTREPRYPSPGCPTPDSSLVPPRGETRISKTGARLTLHPCSPPCFYARARRRRLRPPPAARRPRRRTARWWWKMASSTSGASRVRRARAPGLRRTASQAAPSC